MKSEFKQVRSRITVDVSTFTFGLLNSKTQEFSYKVFCAGETSHYVDKMAPLNGDALTSFIQSLENLEPSNAKAKLKIKINSFTNVNLRFNGYVDSKGYKVKASIGGFLFFSSSGFFSSYCSEATIKNLIENLRRCVSEPYGT